jgi:hypothetical protein
MKILIVCWMLAATAIVSGGMTGSHTGQSGQEESDGGSY